MSNQEQTNQSRLHRAGLIWQFLKGSRWFFLLCMLCAAVSTLADMVTPQIIRVTVDQVLGSAPADQLSPLVRGLLDAAGGAGSGGFEKVASAQFRAHRVFLLVIVIICL